MMQQSMMSAAPTAHPGVALLLERLDEAEGPAEGIPILHVPAGHFRFDRKGLSLRSVPSTIPLPA